MGGDRHIARRTVASGWRIALWIGAWLLAATLLWLAARGADWRAAATSSRHAQPALLVAAILANFGILLLWAALWRMGLPRDVRVGYGRMFEIAAVTSAIMNTIPALVGHASAVALLVKRGGLPARTAGSVMVLDQVGEGVSKLAVLGVALTIVGLPAWMSGAAASVVLLVVALVAMVIVVVAFGGTHLGETRAARLLDGVRSDLQVLRSPARAITALVTALAMKAAEALAIACIILAFDIDLPLASAFVVLGAVNLATMLPLAPGNIGVYEAGAVAAYGWMGVPPEAALAAAVLQHVCFLAPAIGAGVIALAVGGPGTSRLGEALRPVE